MEPTGGFEPPACCLRNSCSTTELRRHLNWKQPVTVPPFMPARLMAYRAGTASTAVSDCNAFPFQNMLVRQCGIAGQKQKNLAHSSGTANRPRCLPLSPSQAQLAENPAHRLRCRSRRQSGNPDNRDRKHDQPDPDHDPDPDRGHTLA